MTVKNNALVSDALAFAKGNSKLRRELASAFNVEITTKKGRINDVSAPMSHRLPAFVSAPNFSQTGVRGRPNTRGCGLKKGSAVNCLIKTAAGDDR